MCTQISGSRRSRHDFFERTTYWCEYSPEDIFTRLYERSRLHFHLSNESCYKHESQYYTFEKFHSQRFFKRVKYHTRWWNTMTAAIWDLFSCHYTCITRHFTTKERTSKWFKYKTWALFWWELFLSILILYLIDRFPFLIDNLQN